MAPNLLAARVVECETLLEAGLLESAREELEALMRLLEENPVPTVGTVVWRDRGRLDRWTGHPGGAALHLKEAQSQAQAAGASDDDLAYPRVVRRRKDRPPSENRGRRAAPPCGRSPARA